MPNSIKYKPCEIKLMNYTHKLSKTNVLVYCALKFLYYGRRSKMFVTENGKICFCRLWMRWNVIQFCSGGQCSSVEMVSRKLILYYKLSVAICIFLTSNVLLYAIDPLPWNRNKQESFEKKHCSFNSNLKLL